MYWYITTQELSLQVTAETQRVPLHGRPAPEVGRAAGGGGEPGVAGKRGMDTVKMGGWIQEMDWYDSWTKRIRGFREDLWWDLGEWTKNIWFFFRGLFKAECRLKKWGWNPTKNQGISRVRKVGDFRKGFRLRVPGSIHHVLLSSCEYSILII